MSIMVEHEARRIMILERAFEVFCTKGYDNVTLQMIADACQLTRTMLYVYFTNKKSIFFSCIKHRLSSIEQKTKEYKPQASEHPRETLKAVLGIILDSLVDNQKLLAMLLPYIINFCEPNSECHRYIKYVTARIRHIMSWILLAGVKSGVLNKCNIKCSNELLISYMYSTALQISLNEKCDITMAKKIISDMIDHVGLHQ